MENVPDTIVVAPDGFLWWKGAKIQARLASNGIEFYEKDPYRAAQMGGPRFVVPFEALENLIDLFKQSHRKEGEHAEEGILPG